MRSCTCRERHAWPPRARALPGCPPSDSLPLSVVHEGNVSGSRRCRGNRQNSGAFQPSMRVPSMRSMLLGLVPPAALLVLAGCDGGGNGGGGGGGGGNSPPAFTSAAAASVAENATGPVLVATARDPDGDALTFSLAGGADAALLQITAGGALSFRTPPDFEAPGDANRDNVYEATLAVSDGQTSTTQAVRISVTD